MAVYKRNKPIGSGADEEKFPQAAFTLVGNNHNEYEAYKKAQKEALEARYAALFPEQHFVHNPTRPNIFREGGLVTKTRRVPDTSIDDRSPFSGPGPRMTDESYEEFEYTESEGAYQKREQEAEQRYQRDLTAYQSCVSALTEKDPEGLALLKEIESFDDPKVFVEVDRRWEQEGNKGFTDHFSSESQRLDANEKPIFDRLQTAFKKQNTGYEIYRALQAAYGACQGAQRKRTKLQEQINAYARTHLGLEFGIDRDGHVGHKAIDPKGEVYIHLLIQTHQSQAEKDKRALNLAAGQGDQAAVEGLLAEGKGDLNAAFEVAIENEQAEALQYLLQAHAPKLTVNLNEALFDAAVDGRAESVRVLLAAGVKPDAHLDEAETALVRIVETKEPTAIYLEIVRQLLEAGADVDARSRHGFPILSLCVQEKSREKFEPLLLKYGAYHMQAIGGMRRVNTNGGGALMIAASPEYLYALEHLYAANMDLDLQDSNGYTALFWALLHVAPEPTRSLLENGARLDSVDARGRSPLDFALSQGESNQNRPGLLHPGRSSAPSWDTSGDLQNIFLLLLHNAEINPQSVSQLARFLKNLGLINKRLYASKVAFCYGALYEARRDYSKAKKHYESALKEVPEAHYRLARLYEKEATRLSDGSAQRAEAEKFAAAHFAALDQLEDQHKSIYYAVGQAYEKEGNLERAKAFYLKAADNKRFPRLARLAEHKLMALYRSDDPQQSQYYYEQLLEKRDPLLLARMVDALKTARSVTPVEEKKAEAAVRSSSDDMVQMELLCQSLLDQTLTPEATDQQLYALRFLESLEFQLAIHYANPSQEPELAAAFAMRWDPAVAFPDLNVPPQPLPLIPHPPNTPDYEALQRRYPRIYYCLGQKYEKEGRFEDAKRCYQVALNQTVSPRLTSLAFQALVSVAGKSDDWELQTRCRAALLSQRDPQFAGAIVAVLRASGEIPAVDDSKEEKEAALSTVPPGLFLLPVYTAALHHLMTSGHSFEGAFTSLEWEMIALDALGNPYFRLPEGEEITEGGSRVMGEDEMRIRYVFALQAVKQAIDLEDAVVTNKTREIEDLSYRQSELVIDKNTIGPGERPDQRERLQQIAARTETLDQALVSAIAARAAAEENSARAWSTFLSIERQLKNSLVGRGLSPERDEKEIEARIGEIEMQAGISAEFVVLKKKKELEKKKEPSVPTGAASSSTLIPVSDSQPAFFSASRPATPTSASRSPTPTTPVVEEVDGGLDAGDGGDQEVRGLDDEDDLGSSGRPAPYEKS